MGGINMKPFNLEKAKQGAEVITRDGRKVQILTFSRRNKDYPIVALIDCGKEDAIQMYTIDGCYNKSKAESRFDLMMASSKVYMNVYREGDTYVLGKHTFSSREKAIDCRGVDYVKTIEIEE